MILVGYIFTAALYGKMEPGWVIAFFVGVPIISWIYSRMNPDLFSFLGNFVFISLVIAAVITGLLAHFIYPDFHWWNQYRAAGVTFALTWFFSNFFLASFMEERGWSFR
jgi:hypothetical protein